MIIRVSFDNPVNVGEIPELTLKFGEAYSVNKTEFIDVTDDNTCIRYKYVVAEGDNGVLTVKRLSGGLITDLTKKIEATTMLHASASGEDDENENGEYENIEEIIEDGINETIEDVAVDTQKPIVEIVSSVEKESNWLRNGDVIKVKLFAEEELQEVPAVTFNGIPASVEGEGNLFTASLPVTEALSDGYVEVKVDNLVDTAGNKRETIVAKDSNIDIPIVVDNAAPIVSSVNVSKDRELQEGDKVDITVAFTDASGVTKEYITTKETPQLKILLGGSPATGAVTCEYAPGTYVEAMKYTYTVAKEDKGMLTVEGMSGTVTDAAGNTSDLGTQNIKSYNEASNKTPEAPVTPTTPVNIKDTTVTTTTTTTTRPPKTGDTILIAVGTLLLVVAVSVLVEYYYRKNRI